MTTPLMRGLYETLITEGLAAELAGLAWELVPDRSELRPAEAPDRIALHLARAIERALAGISDEGARLRIGVDLARRLLDMLSGLISNFDGDADRPIEPAEALRAIVARRGMSRTLLIFA